MRKKTLYFLLFFMLASIFFIHSGYATSAVPTPNRKPLIFHKGTLGILESSGDPILRCDTYRALLNENFYLSWNVDADECILYKSYNSGEYESLGYVDTVQSRYVCNEKETGEYSYTIMTFKEGEDWKQSNIVYVNVFSNEGISLDSDPVITCDKIRARVNECFYLSWSVDADQCVLYRSYNYGSFESLGYVDTVRSAYKCSENITGVYSYVIMTYKEGGEWKQSNSVDVKVYEIALDIDPILSCDTNRAMIDENFYLSWGVDADQCVLYRSYNSGEFKGLGYVDNVQSSYTCHESEAGVYSYAIMTCKDGEVWKQSNIIDVTVYSNEGILLDIDPILTCDTNRAMINESFYLSWGVDTDECVLYKSYNYGSFEELGHVDTARSAYMCNESELGIYSYYIRTRKKGEDWKQSNYIDVSVYADEETSCAYLEQKGMTNTWNLLFMVYRTVHIGDFEKSFTDAQIASVKRSASEMKYTMEGLSDNKMKIGTVDVIVVDEPVTSASGPIQYGGPATLTYGNDGDVDFTYIMDHKDINLVAVFVPLLGFNNQYGWLGLGGTTMNVRGQEIFTVIINDIDTSSERIECYGNEYLTASLACVHEMLHAVETNSRSVGWDDFQDLHSGDDNGYGNGTYYWYHLLMTNTMDNGNLGFLRQSYYVKHRSISNSMRNGLQLDYDGIYRYYINGLPHIIDLYLPEMLTTIESEAFLGTKVKSIFIPSNVNEIGENAFNLGTLFYVKKGSYAETWASENGYTFVQISN